MAYGRIVLPEPPSSTPMAGIPDIFFQGESTVVRRAVIIGNGMAGAENQCLGLVRALGLADTIQLLRVNRPQGRIHYLLRWLPLSLHLQLNAILSSLSHEITSQLLSLLGRQKASSRLSGPKQIQPPPPSLSPNIQQYNDRSLAQAPGRVLTTNLDSQQGSPFLPPPSLVTAQNIADLAIQNADRDGPLLVVASGRDTAAIASSVKRLAPASTFVVQIQHPRSDVSRFDVVVTPGHDFYAHTEAAKRDLPKLQWLLPWISPPPPTDNVIVTTGALHPADSAMLRSAAATWHDQLAKLPKPLLIVNLGAPVRYCNYGSAVITSFTRALATILAHSGGCAQVSFSKRTPSWMRRQIYVELGQHKRVHIWDGRGRNPHMGHLAWGDAFLVTADSVSMVSEACSTGKPVYVIGEECCRWKLVQFHESLRRKGATRQFIGNENMSESWSYPPLSENIQVATKVREKLAERGWLIR